MPVLVLQIWSRHWLKLWQICLPFLFCFWAYRNPLLLLFCFKYYRHISMLLKSLQDNICVISFQPFIICLNYTKLATCIMIVVQKPASECCNLNNLMLPKYSSLFELLLNMCEYHSSGTIILLGAGGGIIWRFTWWEWSSCFLWLRATSWEEGWSLD